MVKKKTKKTVARKTVAKKKTAKKSDKKAKSGKVKSGKPAKLVYSWGNGKAEGNHSMKQILGGKGAGLAEMSRIGLPVPAGFTISIPACEYYYKTGRKFDKLMVTEVIAHVKKLEKTTGKKLGDPKDPLLVSVRSGAAASMPGMMETILNLGLNDVSVEGLANKTKNPRFAYDSYRRFIQMYATTAMGLSKEPMEDMLADLKKELGVKNDPEIPADGLKKLCDMYKKFYKENMGGKSFPQDPMEQLWGATEAVFGSWVADKAVDYRRIERLEHLKGTAVNICQMVYGNKGDNSGTGVAFTRDPNSGENVFYGDCLINAQGEDVVAGIRTPLRLNELDKLLPKAWKELQKVRLLLEKHYKDMQDLEFTIEDGKLYMLQCRTGKRSPAATFQMAVDMVKEKLITREQAISRVLAEDIERLFYPIIDASVSKADLQKAKIANGIDAVPGAACGQVYFTAKTAEEHAAAGEKVILVRKETSPEDVGGMHAAQGILTETGGKTSHAAVVARGWGKCCIVGCEELEIDYIGKQFTAGGVTIKEGEFVTLNGSTGDVFSGSLPLETPKMPKAYFTILQWCDEIRRMDVRTNADSPADARKAIEMGAQGIGLCRTEHMFFETEERRLAMQEMIVAENEEARRAALDKLLPFQRADFTGIFTAMEGLPVTIRLLDPPLHEFTPGDEAGVKKLSDVTGISVATINARIENLHEANPMLGHRGCRLSLTYPEILEMQTKAIIEAAIAVSKKGKKVFPEIMVPLIMEKKELKYLEVKIREVADTIIRNSGVKLAYMVGTMIEIPRAALLANEIAEVAEFFSFGTNDLTQMTLGLSRDDAGRFLPDYVDQSKAAIFRDDPFQSLDQQGVGQLIEMAIAKGRSVRPKIKLGICGEHGGEAESVKFCHRVGLNYVSCSPYRVPIARLSAAQAVIDEKGSKKK